MSSRTHRIGEVARLAGVSVRSLHHYEDIGLLRPSGRTTAGYRLYTDPDLLRLQQILIGRQLGLSLEDIRRLLDDPRLDQRQLLLKQRQQLLERARATAAMIRSVDAALALLDPQPSNQQPFPGAATMDMTQIFEGFDASQYEQEARQRWGDTDAYKESARRTGAYCAQDWKRYKEEYDAVMRAAAGAFQEQRRPDDVTVMELAEQHRMLIDRWFYPCSPRMHSGLAAMYEADQRFAQNIDHYAAGLTPFWSAAIRANAARLCDPGA